MIFPAPVLVQESVAVQEISLTASGHVMADLNYPAQRMLQWYRTDYLSCTSRGKYAVYRKFYPILHPLVKYVMGILNFPEKNKCQAFSW